MASSTFKIELFDGVNFSCPLRPAYGVTVVQTQKADGNTATAFRLPVNVQITTAAGGTVSQKLDINKRVHNFQIKTNGKPTKILLDGEEKFPIKTVKYL